MEKILLTGGDGFFCSRFKKRYEKKYEIISTNRKNMDIVNKNTVQEFIRKSKPDYIIHAAAIANTEFCNENPQLAYEINVKGAVNVAEAAKSCGAKLVFLSTEQVFNGNLESGPYTEEDRPVPNTVYGKNKLKAEKIKASPDEFRGMSFIYEIMDNFPKIFKIPYGTYHMGSKNMLSRYEVVKLILEKIGRRDIETILIKDDKYYHKSRDIRLDCSKIGDFGIRFTDTDKILSEVIEELKI